MTTTTNELVIQLNIDFECSTFLLVSFSFGTPTTLSMPCMWLYPICKCVCCLFQWEQETGKKYRDLSMDERRDANTEIDIMLERTQK